MRWDFGNCPRRFMDNRHEPGTAFLRLVALFVWLLALIPHKNWGLPRQPSLARNDTRAAYSITNCTWAGNAHPIRLCYFSEGGAFRNMDFTLAIILIVVGTAAGIAAGFGVGIAYRKKVAEREIGSAEAEATRLINEAIRSGESRKKEMLLEANDDQDDSECKIHISKRTSFTKIA